MSWAVAVLSLTAMLSYPPLLHDLTHDPVVLQGFAEMFRSAHYGFADAEEAAFVIAEPDGTLSLRRWPSSLTPHRSLWYGARPENAIAIAHTHPNPMKNPSRQDLQTALETGLAVYVISRSGIMKTRGRTIETVANDRWWRTRLGPAPPPTRVAP